MAISLGDLNPLDSIEADLQSYVGKFLQQKAILQNIYQKGILEFKDRASSLLTIQEDLENKLKANLVIIDSLKTSGAWSFGDLTSLGVFAYNLKSHLDEVEKLQNDFNNFSKLNVSASDSVWSSLKNIPWWIWGSGVLIFFMWRKKRRYI